MVLLRRRLEDFQGLAVVERKRPDSTFGGLVSQRVTRVPSRETSVGTDSPTTPRNSASPLPSTGFRYILVPSTMLLKMIDFPSRVQTGKHYSHPRR